MESLFLSNLTSPPLLFFILGLLAAALRSDLEIPEQVAKFLSLYLLFAIGLKGGAALTENELVGDVFVVLFSAVVLASVIPVAVFFALRTRLSIADAAATAATYGSVSAVTFVTATSYLDAEGVAWQGYFVAAMALMESPAIIVGLLLYRLSSDQQDRGGFYAKALLKESLLNGSVFLIMGSLVIGFLSSRSGMAQLQPVVNDLFIGVLCLFLLDMGIVAARRIKDIGRGGSKQVGWLVALGLLIPLVNASVTLLIALMLGLSEGDALLLVVLAASASYIAVPAAMRLALPEANPSTYLAMSLAVTFPFNLLVGIPLYHGVVKALLS